MTASPHCGQTNWVAPELGTALPQEVQRRSVVNCMGRCGWRLLLRGDAPVRAHPGPEYTECTDERVGPPDIPQRVAGGRGWDGERDRVDGRSVREPDEAVDGREVDRERVGAGGEADRR